MKLLVEMNYPDSKDEFGHFVQGDKFQEVKNFEELYQLLKQVHNEDMLNHIHLEFVEEGTNQQYGKVTVLLKETPGFHTLTYL